MVIGYTVDRPIYYICIWLHIELQNVGCVDDRSIVLHTKLYSP